jgi:hypothetical protein
MASQVAHIVYALKYLESNTGKISDPDMFYLGSCFPDIRRIDPKVKRADTHLILEDLNLDLSYLDSFGAGWKFHLFCDMQREAILNKYDFYNLPGAGDSWNLANKHLEDEVVYDAFNNWEKIINLFNNAPFVENNINVSQETFSAWYATLAKYFETKPTSKTMRIFLLKQPKLAPIAKEIVASVDKLRKSDKVVKILSKVKDEISIGM